MGNREANGAVMEVAGDAKERVVVDDEVDSAPAEDKVKGVYEIAKM